MGRGGLGGGEGTSGTTGGGGDAAKGLETTAWVHLQIGRREEKCMRGGGDGAGRPYTLLLAECSKSAAPSHWEQTPQGICLRPVHPGWPLCIAIARLKENSRYCSVPAGQGLPYTSGEARSRQPLWPRQARDTMLRQVGGDSRRVSVGLHQAMRAHSAACLHPHKRVCCSQVGQAAGAEHSFYLAGLEQPRVSRNLI